jgi:hypothetical protein
LKIVNVADATTAPSALFHMIDHTDRQPGEWLSVPGWENFSYRPDILAPLQTDEDLADAGWC